MVKELNADVALTSLIYGRFLLSISPEDGKIKGTIIDENGNYLRLFDFPSGFTTDNNYMISQFKNGTMNLYVEDFSRLTWTVSSFQVETPIIYDFGNPEIVSADPPINSEISLSLSQVTVNYKVPIAISTNNVSIHYQWAIVSQANRPIANSNDIFL